MGSSKRGIALRYRMPKGYIGKIQVAEKYKTATICPYCKRTLMLVGNNK